MTPRLLSLLITLVLSSAPAVHAQGPSKDILPAEFRSQNGGRVWVYIPPNAQADAKLSCVLVPPAGSRVFDGLSLGEGDRAEHTPYVSAGYAVVSFDISGPWSGSGGDAELQKAVKAFTGSKCGINDALDALKLALEKYPQIDPNRVFVAGHSSAATLALQIAANSPQIKGCIAYAPVTDLETHLGGKLLKGLDSLSPGSAQLFHDLSPSNQIDAFHCPVFLFHADDDTTVPTAAVVSFRDALSSHKKQVELVSVSSGGHYDSMITQGIPKGIVWLNALNQKLP